MGGEFRALGPLELRVDGLVVELGHVRQRCVLAVLLAEANRVVTAEQLLDRVWVDRPPHRARRVLSTYVSRLRRLLADEAVIVSRHGGYALVVDPEAVDVHRFRKLVTRAGEADDEHRLALLDQALALWRGDPLSELDTPWAADLRATLDGERLAAELEHADTALRLGRHAELLPALAERVRRHPLDERVAEQFVLALYRSGRQADALEHYRRVRDRLVGELGADPGPHLRHLHQRILTADPGLAVTRADRASPVATPRQLPAPPRPFTGRSDESAALTEALEPPGGAVAIAHLTGSGGIGKTWLALHWAHRHLDRFPDGQLFVDLCGFSPTSPPTAPEDALRGFLGALGVTADRVPRGQDAQAALFRSLLTGKRVLVVLDNAVSTEQVVPLLPGSPSCTVLVTSRHRLPALSARHGARTLPLGVLTDTESLALLTGSLGDHRVVAERDAAAELVALCGGCPLALALTATLAHRRPSLTETVAELRESGSDALDADDPAASLPAVLSSSLRNLTEEQRTVFGLLAIAPGTDTTLPAVASLTGSTPARTRKVLAALEDASLLEHRSPGRYVMHDLVRGHAATTARTTVPNDVREAALARVLDFYLHTAFTADRLLDPHGPLVRPNPPAPGTRPLELPDAAAATAWLAAEHTTLLAAQRAAGALGRHHAVWHLAWALETFHVRRGRLRDALTAWQAALDVADHLPDRTTRTRTLRNLGDACSRLGRHEEATDRLDQALDLAVRHQDTLEQAHTHRALALAWERAGDDELALRHAHHALDLYRDLDQPVWEADALNQVGWSAARLGDHSTARVHCTAALARYRRHHHLGGEANTLDSLGLIAHRTGDHGRAVEYYHQALPLFRTLGHAYQVAETLDSVGDPHVALGQHDQARAAWHEAVVLYREQGRDLDARRLQRRLDDLDRSLTGVPPSPSWAAAVP
ncbi:BTAD domain-containing putative transcriptional regulator [Actinosynnema sp. NPDC053489]|uniref:AfsR/SARP family transcriptional regulator n=1 Tax=Actinosynnema sp. NPDC053489 TaxID=3363916 RepID=UPI0037C53011